MWAKIGQWFKDQWQKFIDFWKENWKKILSFGIIWLWTQMGNLKDKILEWLRKDKETKK